MIVVAFFIAHWQISVFFQSFFLHRYGAHRHFTMSKFWERFFYFCTFLFQNSSFLSPRAYAILHRAHHAYSDTEKDPHSPIVNPNFFKMMWKTKVEYEGVRTGKITPEERFEGGYPTWPALDRIGDMWITRLAFVGLIILFYVKFATAPWQYALLPIHFLMGPVHGAIVNWCGHKYGYQNFDNGDHSRNSLFFDFLTGGELFQNNHHKFGQSPKFAARWFEVDTTYLVMKVFAALGIIKLGPQRIRYPERPVLAEDPRPGLSEEAAAVARVAQEA